MSEAGGGVRSGQTRDRLANERTLLAWIRTAIAFMAFGVALAKLGIVVHIDAMEHPDLVEELPSAEVSQLIGASLIAVGGVLTLVGGQRTRLWSRKIDPEAAPPSRLPLALTAILTFFASIALFVYVLL
ncbi:MAG TPA: DUF202 domain-containing protein [Polyangiaceae bacterium LLY-WYZ-15_(1-7)]|nr:hypothetical protein [Myxococcales bacterium]MAT25626.1 hypothetical protein [Sandaracinus sp.]HJK89122.1 DUF202 domain-containing protein [Polyangiaceae bacterium LLY-WYZ-15_(1-7)]HJL01807.1 DUF202 domain-containing protein [Polyangiaceae bacterium LLY-WYZ-15_(1-7)]HJL09149.1 DUF202 domain-containing protein [Polyangiaceae bacterium LLY-WYZ-15_(1-7)]